MPPEIWDTTVDAIAMLNALFPMHGSGSTLEQPRKLRLYYCALLREKWRDLPTVFRAACLAAEAYADEPHDRLRFDPIRHLAEEWTRCEGNEDDLAEWERVFLSCGFTTPVNNRRPAWSAREWHQIAIVASLPFAPEVPNADSFPRSMHRADYLRDIFEPPQYPTSFEPIWRSTAVVDLARSMLSAGRFDSHPQLADALEEAGCDRCDLLDHCRNRSAVHVRGCWAIDRILARDPFAVRSGDPLKMVSDLERKTPA